MNLTKKRWIVLFASCMINLCIGSTYAWSVFASPMAKHLSEINGLTGASALTAGSLALAFTICNSIGPVTMITGGRINDMIGPRWVIFIGGLLFGLGMVVSGFATSVPVLVIAYGLGCGLGMGMVYGCTINNSVKFFPDKRGLIGGIATATYGLSSVIVPPIADALIDSVGVTETFEIFGILFLIIVCGGAFFIQKCPSDFVPDGFTPHIQKGNSGVARDKDWRQMLKDPIAYIMIIMLTCGAFCGLMVVSQASPMAQSIVGVSATVAATAVSIIALFNAAGRIVAGYLSDKFGRINTLSIVFVISMIGLGLLYVSKAGNMAMFMTGVSIIGICFGSFMGVFPGFTADQFGPKHNSVNYGIMFIGFALAGMFGPMIVSKVFAATGKYQDAFIIAAVMAIFGLLLTFVYRKREKA
ncbi:OFA family MFS transporter [Paenibacillus puldeungensis]|uniref:OFA family MFS transporter n=1 Tax=Paenibacillus puldeungensis TaxID=696536 RepID=A0ABW3RSB2_9BACL